MINPSAGRTGRVFALFSNASEPGMVAVFEGILPAQTRPYGYNKDYLEIIWRAWRISAGLFNFSARR
ncbi:MAG TPA: hypothetical protein VIK64_06195 [Anaerolineales bacterium]